MNRALLAFIVSPRASCQVRSLELRRRADGGGGSGLFGGSGGSGTTTAS